MGRLVRADDLGRPDVEFRVASALRAAPKKRGFTVGSHNAKEYRKTRAKATTPPVAGDSHATDTFLRWVVNAGLKNDGHDAIDREAASGYSADESISRRSARFRRFPVPTGPRRLVSLAVPVGLHRFRSSSRILAQRVPPSLHAREPRCYENDCSANAKDDSPVPLRGP